MLLTGYQTPETIRAASEAGLTDYRTEHGAWRRNIPAMAATAHAAAQAQTVRLPGEATTAALIESLPGLGPILGAEFVVATGGTLDGFATPLRLASYAGLVPVPQDSGRVSGNLRRPKRYNRRLRRVFSMAALSSIKANGPSRTFYDKKRGERHIHTQALLALARRLIDVLWALLRDGRTFTPTAPQPITSTA